MIAPDYSQWTPEQLAEARAGWDESPFKIPMIPPASKKSAPNFLHTLASAAFLTTLSVAVLFVGLAVYFHG